jgi:glucan phosphoethanolaminetransferase (alkaline phosphatase superfamily)
VGRNVFIHLALILKMAVGVMLFVIAVLIIAIWVIIEVKRLRHKIFAIVLIALILFTYLSFTMVMKQHDVDLKTVSGIIEAAGLYVNWLGSLFGNFKSMTTHAIGLDWSGNETSG